MLTKYFEANSGELLSGLINEFVMSSSAIKVKHTSLFITEKYKANEFHALVTYIYKEPNKTRQRNGKLQEITNV